MSYNKERLKQRAMNRVYVIPCSKLPNEIGYLEIINMNEEQIQSLPHEVFSPSEFENEWNADIKGSFFSTEQFVRFF